MSLEVQCATEVDTVAVAGRLAAEVGPGDVVVLAGGLGTGKTVFTRGLAAGLGVEEAVTSPSFVIMREYHSGFLPVIHVDLYRLSSLHEFEDVDVFERARQGLLVIEWGEAVAASLPEDRLTIRFEVGADGARVLRFEPSGTWRDRDLARVVR